VDFPLDAIPTPNQPWSAGPYSTALRAGDWIVISGQIGVDPSTGELVSGGVEAQARQALANLAAVIGDCGCDWSHVAKVTQFVAEESPQWMNEVNAAYAEVVGEHRPARSTVGVTWLPMGAAYEIEAWVFKPLIKPEA
jgi:2-iminobutanoate/2-iminopropanoate deaminase